MRRFLVTIRQGGRTQRFHAIARSSVLAMCDALESLGLDESFSISVRG